MNFKNISMKKVLIIGYGDIGRRWALICPQHKCIGGYRIITQQQDNVEFIQLDWVTEYNHHVSK